MNAEVEIAVEFHIGLGGRINRMLESPKAEKQAEKSWIVGKDSIDDYVAL